MYQQIYLIDCKLQVKRLSTVIDTYTKQFQYFQNLFLVFLYNQLQIQKYKNIKYYYTYNKFFRKRMPYVALD